MFKLQFSVPPLSKKLAVGERIAMMGSCFSDTIGEKLATHKWQVLSNPFGTIYNPLSIFQLINQSLQDAPIDERLIEHQGINYSWRAHSQLSHPLKEELVRQLRDAQQHVRLQLQAGHWLVITPGTAWVYELVSNGQIVANCHRQPMDQFRKRLLSVDEILLAFQETQRLLPKNIQCLFTVSPVRHVRDGLVENNRSKAILLESTHQIVNTHANCHYFPSYEIVIDELRDYRFFAEDMVHPNKLAIDYVWQQLVSSWMVDDAIHFIKEWQTIRAALEHRPRHPNTPGHQKFLNATIRRLKRLEKKADISVELEQLKSQLSA